MFDAIDLQPHVMAALAASPSLLALLSGIPCVFLHDAHRTAVLGSPSPRESRIVHQPDKPPWFPRAQRASVTGMIERAPFAMLHAILIPQLPAGAVLHSSLSAPPPPLPSVRLPLLHTLRLSVIEQHDEPMEHTAASMQPLALLPLLRTLVIDELEGGMDYTGFRFLCSLPLAHLDLHGVHITPTATITAMSESDEALYPVTNTWSVLRLPTFDPAVWLTDAMLDTLLEQYITSDATAASGLRYISLETPQPAAAFARLAAVRTLRSMDVRLQPRHGVPTDTGALPVDALLSHQLLPTLPNLRHLRIRNNLPVHGGQPLGTAEQHVTPSLPYIQLLTGLLAAAARPQPQPPASVGLPCRLRASLLPLLPAAHIRVHSVGGHACGRGRSTHAADTDAYTAAPAHSAAADARPSARRADDAASVQCDAAGLPSDRAFPTAVPCAALDWT